MTRLISWIVFIAFAFIVCVAAGWYIKTPQPIRPDVQAVYLKDTAVYEVYDLVRNPNGGELAYWAELAHAGNIPAQLRMAELLFVRGKDNAKAYDKAVIYMEILSEKGIPMGQNALGTAIRHGLGVPVDKVEAYKWFKLAGETGYQLARDNMLELGMQLNRQEIEQAVQRSDEWRAEYLRKPFNFNVR